MFETIRNKREVIIRCTAAQLLIPFQEMVGPGRSNRLFDARCIAVLLIFELAPASSLSQIGTSLNRDHTTIINIRRRSVRMLKDPEFIKNLDACRQRVLSWRPKRAPAANAEMLEQVSPEMAISPPVIKSGALSPYLYRPVDSDDSDVIENITMRWSINVGSYLLALALAAEHQETI